MCTFCDMDPRNVSLILYPYYLDLSWSISLKKKNIKNRCNVIFKSFYIKMNVNLYVVYRIVKCAFDHMMMFSKVDVHKPMEVSELVQPIIFSK